MTALAIIAAVGLIAFGVIVGGIIRAGNPTVERPVILVIAAERKCPAVNAKREDVPPVPGRLVDLDQYRKSCALRSRRLLDRAV